MAGLMWTVASIASSSEDEAFFDADDRNWQWSVDAGSEIEALRRGASTPFERIFPPSLYCQRVVPPELSEEMAVPAQASPSQETRAISILRTPSEKREPKKTVTFSLAPTVFLVEYIYTSDDFYSKSDEERNRLLIALGDFADDEESDSENATSQPPVLSMEIHSITYDWQVKKMPQTLASPYPRRIPSAITSVLKPSMPLLGLPQRKARTVKEDRWVGKGPLVGQFEDVTLQASSSQMSLLLPITEEDEGE